MTNNSKGFLFRGRTMVYLIIALAWAGSAYLFLRSGKLSDGLGQESDFCKIIFGHSCDQILLNPVSWQLDYPLAAWGLIYFAIVGFIFVFNKVRTDKAVLVFSLLGAGINSILAATALFQVVPFCPLCLVINFLSLLLPIVIWRTIRNPRTDNQTESKAGKLPSKLSWKLILAAAFICGVVLQIILVNTGPIKAEQNKYESILTDFQQESVFDFPMDANSPRLGPADAPVQLVVFSSFQCPACKVFAYSTQYLQDKYENNIAITFKNFPLSTTCNPALSENMQPRACEAAIAAMAANQQGHFWDYHNILFASDLSASDTLLLNSARQVGLDLSKWRDALFSNETWNQVTADIELANHVKVLGTPTVFLNGRIVEYTQLPVLEFLINSELKDLSK